MKKVIGFAVAAGAVMAVAMFGEPAGQAWIGDGAYAQSRSSACYQNCRNVRKWPGAQCGRYCKGRS